MKKLLVFGFALFLVIAFTLPAAALENKFGGFFDTSFNYYSALNYQDDRAAEYSTIRTRSHLYYTAEISKDLKFVNMFEMDTTWGEQASYGDIGSDATVVEVKRTYLDFNLADLRFEIGTQNFNLHRGLGFNDDMSGMKVSWRGAEKSFIPAFWWFRLNDGDKGATNDGADVDQYTALVNIKAGNVQFVPSVSYLYSSNGVFYSAAPTTPTVPTSSARTVAGDPMKIYVVGLDVNVKADKFAAEFTGIYEGGQLSDSQDISAFALWGKVGFNVGVFGARVAALYTSGEDATPSGDYDGFWYPEQNSWGRGFSTSEYYRKGLEWAKTPYNNGNNLNRTDGNAPENRMEFGLGVDFNLAKDHKLAFDYWNLNFAEDNLTGNSDIGNEFDLKYTWQIMKNLQSNLVFAYLIHGDAIKPAANDASGSYETFLNLRLSF